MNQSLRVYLECVSVRGGALSMEMDGLLVTHKLHVDNWDLEVRIGFYSEKIDEIHDFCTLSLFLYGVTLLSPINTCYTTMNSHAVHGIVLFFMFV